MAEPIAAYQDDLLGQMRGMLSGDVDPDAMRLAVPGDPATAPQVRSYVLGWGRRVIRPLWESLPELQSCGYWPPPLITRCWRNLRRGWKTTTRRGPAPRESAPDLVGRDFTAARPHALWVAIKVELLYRRIWRTR
jgi:hypothetical protein